MEIAMERQLWRLIKESQFWAFEDFKRCFFKSQEFAVGISKQSGWKSLKKISFYNTAKGSNISKHSIVNMAFMRLFVVFQTICFFWLSLNYWKMQRVDVELIRQQFPLKSASAAFLLYRKKGTKTALVFIFSHPILFAMIKYRKGKKFVGFI